MTETFAQYSNSTSITSAGDAAVVTIGVDLIRAGEFQARRRFADTTLDDLAASIARSGVIQPVIVRGDPTSGYTLLAGERRWRAATRAGLHELPAIVRNDLDDDAAAIVGLVENLQRESLGVIDTARGLHSLCAQHELTHDAVAARIGKSRAYVSNYLRVLSLDKAVQAVLDAGELSLGHAKVLAGVAPVQQVKLARQAVSKKMSVRALERSVRQQAQTTPPPDAQASAHAADLAALERNLSAYLGNSVQIHYAAADRRGQLRIDFHDLDEFEGLLARLGFEPN